MSSAEPYTSPFVLEYAYKRSLGPVLSHFFTALRDGQVLGVKTPSGRVLVPPTEYDPETGNAVEGWVPVGPGGTVKTWTTSDDGAWALVQLDGADTALLHRVLGDTAGLATGARVTLELADERVGTMHDIAGFRLEGA